MKKIIFISVFLFALLNIHAQSRHYQNNNFRENITSGISNELRYDNSYGMTATLANGFSNTKEYSDNRNNKVTYSKEIWANILNSINGNEQNAFYWLIDTYWDMRGVQEEFKKGFRGELEYKNNNGLSASFGKDIFGAMEYKDSNSNKVSYSKEFWGEILSENGGDEMPAFMTLLFDHFSNKKNYTEEYTVDIFGYLEYKNSASQTASLSKDIFDTTIYKDSKGNKLEFSKESWRGIVDREGSEKRAFVSLISSYLFGNNVADDWQKPNRPSGNNKPHSAVSFYEQIVLDITDMLIANRSVNIDVQYLKDMVMSINRSRWASVNTDAFGTYIKDNAGNTITLKSDAFGTYLKDSNGYQITINKDAFGNYVKDSNGHDTTIKSDTFGVYVKDNKGKDITIKPNR